MGTRTSLSDETEARLEMAAVVTQHQLQYARGIVASAGISSPEITAAVVHALAINYAAALGVQAGKTRASAAKKAAPAAAAQPVAGDTQPDLLMPDPFGSSPT